MGISTQKVNFKQCPQRWDVGRASKDAKLVIGDIHGNAIKLLYILIAAGVIDMKSEDYQRCVDLYYDHKHKDSAESAKEFNECLSKVRINPDAPDIHFLGDIVVDRGRNDQYTKEIFMQIFNQPNGPQEWHNQADHDVELGYHYNAATQSFYAVGRGQNRQTHAYEPLDFKFNPQTGNSFHQFIQLAEQTPALQSNADEFFRYYIKRQRLVDTIEDQDGNLSLCTHAPIGQETLRALGELYGLDYPEFDEKGDVKQYHQDLKKFIDAVNECYLWHEASGDFYQQLEVEMRTRPAELQMTNNGIPVTHPLARLLWNRATNFGKPVGDKLIEPFPKSAGIQFIFGHDGNGKVPEQLKDSHLCLDDEMGKCKSGKKEQTEGELTVYVGSKTPKPDLQPKAPDLQTQVLLKVRCLPPETPIRKVIIRKSQALNDLPNNAQWQTLLDDATTALDELNTQQHIEYRLGEAYVRLEAMLRSIDSSPLQKVNQTIQNTVISSRSVDDLRKVIDKILKSEGVKAKLFTKREKRAEQKPEKYLLLDTLKKFKTDYAAENDSLQFLLGLSSALDSLEQSRLRQDASQPALPQVSASSSSSSSSSPSEKPFH